MFAALEWTGTAERVVLASAVVLALGILWRYIVRPVWRLIRFAVAEVREEVERRKKIDDLIHRELTPNGGSSMKDSATRAAGGVKEAAAAAERAATTAEALTAKVAEVQESQETIYQLLDNVVERKDNEHAEIWSALAALGIDRRHKEN